MASIKKTINGMISEIKLFELNMFCLKILSELSEILSKVYIGLHVKYPILFSDFKEISIFSIDLQTKKTHNQNSENPSSGSRAIPRGRTDGQI